MDTSVALYVRIAREAWEQGFAYVASRINPLLVERADGVVVEAPEPRPRATLWNLRRRFLNAIVGLRPFVLEMASEGEIAPWSLGFVNGRENQPFLIGGPPYETEAALNEVLEFLSSRDWPADRWQSDIVNGIMFEASSWRWSFDELAKRHSNNQLSGGQLPADPITIKEMAILGHLTDDAVHNWPKKGRPKPNVPNSGRQAAVFSYGAIRPWFILKRADLSPYWPESYAEAMQSLKVLSQVSGPG